MRKLAQVLKKILISVLFFVTSPLVTLSNTHNVYDSSQIEIKFMHIMPGEQSCLIQNNNQTTIYFNQSSLVRIVSNDNPDLVKVFETDQIYSIQSTMWSIQNIGNNQIKLILIEEKEPYSL